VITAVQGLICARTTSRTTDRRSRVRPESLCRAFPGGSKSSGEGTKPSSRPCAKRPFAIEAQGEETQLSGVLRGNPSYQPKPTTDSASA